MRGVIATLLCAFSLMACASVQAAIPLHELPYEEAPEWDLVSVKGLSEHLKKVHETDTVTRKFYEWDNERAEAIVTERNIPVRVSHVDLEEFLKPRGVLRIRGKSKSAPEAVMHISFKTCFDFMISYLPQEAGFKARDYHDFEVGCWSKYEQKQGKEVYLRTQIFLDPFIRSVLMDVTNYSVSKDGKMLTLLGQGSEELGLFKRKEAAE